MTAGTADDTGAADRVFRVIIVLGFGVVGFLGSGVFLGFLGTGLLVKVLWCRISRVSILQVLRVF
jgi:hypothetical protein